MPDPSPRALVTGSSGFIGTRLCKYLRDNRPFVDGMDIVAGPQTNILAPNYEYFSSFKPDVVFHMACIRMGDCEQRPTEAYLSNLAGVVRLVEEFPNAIHILASTSSMYAPPLMSDLLPPTTFNERDRLEPKTIYAQTKFAAEKFLERNCRNYRILRFGNVYGPGHDPLHSSPGVVAKFVYQALKGEPLTVYGNQTRDFVYVDDVVRGINQSIFWQPNEAYNLASGYSTPISALAKTIIMLSSFAPSGRVIYANKERSIDTLLIKRLSIAKARAQGWTPGVDLIEGLRRTIEWQNGL